jgi:hypothetical protein
MKNNGFFSAPILLTQGLGCLFIVIIFLMLSACSPVAPSIEKRALSGKPNDLIIKQEPTSKPNLDNLTLDTSLLTQDGFANIKAELPSTLELGQKYVTELKEKGSVKVALPENPLPKNAYVVLQISEQDLVDEVAAVLNEDVSLDDLKAIKLKLKSSPSKDVTHTLSIASVENSDEKKSEALISEIKKQLSAVALSF